VGGPGSGSPGDRAKGEDGAEGVSASEGTVTGGGTAAPREPLAHAGFTAPFQCPCDTAEYDCHKRAPVRAGCACRRLLCRKCAGVAGSMPGPSPCTLCGAEAVGPFEAADFQRDAGLLLALVDRLGPRQP
jgi:hypothetical protein